MLEPVDKAVLKKAIKKAARWSWRLRNEDFGWGNDAVVIRDSFVLDGAELMAGLMKAGISPSSSKMKQSLEWVKKELTAKDKWWIKSPEASKFFLWPVFVLLLAKEPASSPVISQALSELKQFKVPGKGWNNALGGDSNIYVTALALICLPKISATTEDLKEAKAWLMSVQNQDGSWGYYPTWRGENICTSIATWGLIEAGVKDSKAVKKATQWLLACQRGDGHWQLNYEVGAMDGHGDAYIHFSTPWALTALLKSGMKATDEPMIRGMKYLLSFQDKNGGWPATDISILAERLTRTTWATGNVLMAIAAYLKT